MLETAPQLQPKITPKSLPRPDLRHRRLLTALLLLVALAVRVTQACREVLVNPDVIRFIDQARQLSTDPLAALRNEVYHPLHSALTAVAHIPLAWFLEDRSAWIVSTKVVGIASALVVTWCILRLARHLGAPYWAALGSAFLWTIGRRTANYGADGLSDMLYLALFAAALLTGMQTRLRWRPAAWLAAGVLAGLSYLTRPEGTAAALILGAGVVLYYVGFHPRMAVLERRRPQVRGNRGAFRWGEAGKILGMLAFGFVVVAGPYMIAIGKFTGKKQIIPVATSVSAEVAGEPVAAAGLGGAVRGVWRYETWRRVGQEISETFGFAPCLVVGLAIVLRPRFWGRRHWRGMVAVWILLWLTVMIWLLLTTEYLDGRHTLALQLALHPVFALALTVWAGAMAWWMAFWRRLFVRGRPVWELLPAWMRWRGWPGATGGTLLALACLPGLVMLQDAPSRDKRFIREAADWLRAHADPRTVVAGELRLGYYSGLSHAQWEGKPGEPHLQALRANVDRPLLLSYVFQLDKGQQIVDRIGPYVILPERWHADESLHGDVLVLYALPGGGAIR